MNTETTDNSASPVGRVCYDTECRLCRGAARRAETILARHWLKSRPLSSAASRQGTGPAVRAGHREMLLVLGDGRTSGGADALVEIARRIWWAWPIWAFSRIPGVMPGLRHCYRLLAANRKWLGGGIGWLPLLLPVAVVPVRSRSPAWVFMWVLSVAIFLACKWGTLRRATLRPSTGAALAYLIGWPGMEADAFLTGRAMERPKPAQWIIAAFETLAGAGLLRLAVGASIRGPSILTAWLGMSGIVLMLHFGLFQILSLAWRAAGREARPLMRAPLKACSLADFWGNRWNTAFHALARKLVFQPLARPLGVVWATLAVFMVSGLVHDLVISFPAGGGFGWPTAYFLVQGAGVLFERCGLGRRLGLGQGWRGWMFTLAIVITPARWLFHASFIHNVIIPMLQAMAPNPNKL